MSTVIFHRLAAQEYKNARRWYRHKSQKAEQRFVEEVNRCVLRIAADPDCGTRYGRTHRWVRCRRYPYLVFYRVVDEQTVHIIAVAHARRREGYWRSRRLES